MALTNDPAVLTCGSNDKAAANSESSVPSRPSSSLGAIPKSGSASANPVSVAPRKRSNKRGRGSTYKTACRVLEHLTTKVADDLTPKQAESLAWARSVVDQGPPNPDPAVKRQRSLEVDPPLNPPGKKARTNRSFSDVAKGALVLGVMDSNNPNASTLKNNWRLVTRTLSSNFMKVLRDNPGPPPTCREIGWYQNSIRMVQCDDNRSAMLYKLAISQLGEVWPGASLKAVDRKDLPVRPRARVWLPDMPADPAGILEMLQFSNPKLPTHDWKVVSVSDPKDFAIQAVVTLNRESVGPLTESAGEVRYGFGKATLKLYKADVVASSPVPGSVEQPGPSKVTASCEAVTEETIVSMLDSVDIRDSESISGSIADEVISDTASVCSLSLLDDFTPDADEDDDEGNKTVVEVKPHVNLAN